ncbi:MAG: hypothetical protein ABEJ56_01480 [Candidatus Nanohaloarchaea archaeon]
MVVYPKEALDRYDDIREATADIETIADRYESDALEEAAEYLNDLIQDTPSDSMYNLMDLAEIKLRDVNVELEPEDAKKVNKAERLLNSEIDRHPAHGKDRHHSATANLKNL